MTKAFQPANDRADRQNVRVLLVIKATLSLLVLTLFAGNLSAQVATSENAQDDRPTVSVDFPGGKLGDFVAALTKSGKLNAIVEQDVSDVELPSISFTDVPVHSAIGIITRLKPEMIDVEADGQIMIIRYDRKYKALVKPAVNVMAVSEILKDMKQEDLLSAIEIGLEMQGSETDPKVTLKLHSETGLLFAKGTRDQLQVISDVVHQLSGFNRSRRNSQSQSIRGDMQIQQARSGNQSQQQGRSSNQVQQQSRSGNPAQQQGRSSNRSNPTQPRGGR